MNPMKNLQCLTALSVLVVFISQARAIELPGSDLWTDLLLGEIDTNGDRIVDSGEWQGAVGNAFDALDPQRDGVLNAAKIDAVHNSIAGTLGEAGATFAIRIIKSLLGISDAKTVTREDFDARAAAIVQKLDDNEDAALDEAELKRMPIAFLAWIKNPVE